MTRRLTQQDQIFGSDGLPLVGAKQYFYQTGTVVPYNVFTDAGLTTPASQPLISNADGRFPDVFLLDAGTDYRVTVTTPDDVTIYQRDNVKPQLNPSIYARLSQVRQLTERYGTTSGSGGAYVLTLTTAAPITAYTEALSISIRANHENAGAATLNLNSLGAIAIEYNGLPLEGGQIRSGSIYDLIYTPSGTFEIKNPSPMKDQVCYPKIYGATTAGAAVIASSTGLYRFLEEDLTFKFSLTLSSKGGMAGAIRVELYKDAGFTQQLLFSNDAAVAFYPADACAYQNCNMPSTNILAFTPQAQSYITFVSPTVTSTFATVVDDTHLTDTSNLIVRKTVKRRL